MKKKLNKISNSVLSEYDKEAIRQVIAKGTIEAGIVKGIGEQLADAHKAIALSLAASLSIESENLFKKSFSGIADGYIKALVEFQKMHGDLKPIMENTMRRLPDAFIELSIAGWFLDYDITPGEVVGLADKIKEGGKDEVDEILTKNYHNNFEELIEILSIRHLERSHIIKEIKICYESNLLYAAIPTVFSLIDGICFQYTSNEMFRVRDRAPRVYNYLSTNSKKEGGFLLGPLRGIRPVGANEDHEVAGELNRHTVMHGKDLTYGNQTNFFKSLSLLKYLSDVLHFWSYDQKP